MHTVTIDTNLALTLLNNLPEAVVYFTPVLSDTEAGTLLTDFELTYGNHQAAHLLQVAPESFVGQKLSTLVHTNPAMRQNLLQQLRQVYQTGLPLESPFFNPGAEKYLHLLYTRVKDGVLVAVQNRITEQQQQQEKDRESALTNSIFNASIHPIFACEAIRNESGTIVDLQMMRINKAFTQIIGLSEEKVIGKRYLDLFPSGRENGTFALNCDVIETGRTMRRELYYKGDQLDAWYDISLSKMGKDGLLVSFADVTAQKNAFLQLSRQKSLLDNLLAHSANGISVTEVIRNESGQVVDGKTILANEAAVNFTGIPREMYLTKTAIELDPDILQSPYYRAALTTLQTGEPQFTQHFLQMTGRWLEISLSKLDDDHLITIFTDITGAKESNQQLEKSLGELRRSNESLEEFTRAASHDLKEPIRKMQYFSDRLKAKLEGRLSEEEKNMMERMENAAARMKLLVDDLLEYSHVNAQPFAAMEAIDLNQKLNLVLSDLELMVAEKNATITIEKLPVITGHRRQVQQLFHNLLNNAMKYSRPGVPPVITVAAKETSGQASGVPVAAEDAEKPFYLITVTDNGIGFEQEYAQKIFNVFTRLHGNSEYKGTGIGLAIVRKVVENHQGYIAAESNPGSGTTFKLLWRR